MIKYNIMSNLNNLSVLIVTWNGDDLLNNCLSSIFSVYGDALEIIVVDNANLESTKKLVSSFKNTKYIASASNLGFAGGNNLGLPACTKKYVLLLNNDTLISKDSFSPLIDYMEKNPQVAVTQGRMRLAKSGNVLDECGVMLTPVGILYDEYIMLDDSTYVPTRPVHSVKGAMMMIRKEVIAQVGGLFYDHFHCNYEEKDFCHRVWMCGFEVHYVDTPAIDHLQSQTIKRMNQVEIIGQTLANQIFSLGTTMEICNAIRITGTVIFLGLFISLYSILKGRLSNAKEFTWCLKSLWKRRKLFYKARKDLQTNRSISDKTLFSKTMSRPGIKYYYQYFKGSLLEYRQRTAGKTEKPIPFN